MPQNTTVPVPAKTWTQITNADATNITFQNLGNGTVLVKATAGAVAPTDATGAMALPAGLGEKNVALADIWPGVSGANRVWVYSNQLGAVFTSHA